MGFFDVGSMRSKKSSAEFTQEARMQRRKNNEQLAAYLGLDYTSGAGGGRSSAKPSGDRLHEDFATGRSGHPPAAAMPRQNGPASVRGTARRSKLERMMGTDVPLPDSLTAPAAAASQDYGSNSFASPNSSAHHLPLAKGSFNAMSQRSSNSRGPERQSSVSSKPYETQLSASTTFTEMAEVDCPICLEPLPYRLAGEKPHVVPNCGHALHNACFTAVYGSPEAIVAQQNAAAGVGNGRLKGASQVHRAPPAAANPPGMCGVCRRAIVLGGDESTAKSHKLTGLGPYGSQADRTTVVSDSASARAHSEAHEDDALKSQPKGRAANVPSSITMPTIRARPEYSIIYKKADKKDNSRINVVCVLSVEVPTRRPPMQESASEHSLDTIEDHGFAEEEYDEEEGRDYEGEDSYSDDLKRCGSEYIVNNRDGNHRSSPLPASYNLQGKQPNSPGRSISPESQAGFSYGVTPVAALPPSDPIRAELEDLRTRVADWKGHSLEHFGALMLHDLLNVRQDSVVREFHVYLFEGALLCVTEEKHKGLSRFIPTEPQVAAGTTNDMPTSPKPALKLKGRIYLKHIRRVIDSSVAGELSISITMDESLDQFVLCFRNEESLSIWKARLIEKVQAQTGDAAATAAAKEGSKAEGPSSNVETASAASHSVAGHSTQHGTQHPDESQRVRNVPVHGVSVSRANSGAASVVSGKTGSLQGSALSPADYRNLRRLSNVSSAQSHASHRSRASVASDWVPRHQQWSASGGLDPRLPPPPMLPHTPIDLVLMFAVPPVLPNHAWGSINSSAALKLRLVRSTLDFIVSHMGPNDRVSLLAYSVGYEGEVKRTALLNPRRPSSRRMLGDFIQCVGRPWNGHNDDPFRVDLDRLGGSSERTDSVTAVNVGLDIVLQRKRKNPITGMILVNDTADGPKRHQMDLVMARAEAANVPIHCFGYGKTHDPSSLWLISNHTKGSYTFVREWYQLRECLAGCIGSMMSIALTDVKLHVSVPHDNHFRVRKIAGMPGAIISSSGKDVDIDMGDVRFGEARELLVELELDLDSLLPRLNGGHGGRKLSVPPIEQGSATDDFMQRLGIQGLSLADSAGVEGSFDHLIDEVPVFEADAGFRDPMTGTSTSRLANPTILTLEIDCQSADPISSGPPGLAAAMADPTVTRRRLEVLVSEMITRSLLLISRTNYAQAQKVFDETRRIIETVLRAIPLPSKRRRPLGNTRSAAKRQRDALNRKTIDSLMAMMNDLDTLLDGLEVQNRATFERDGRNFGAQQAMILRDQKAWTTRTDTEYHNFRDDNAAAFVAYGAAYASSR